MQTTYEVRCKQLQYEDAIVGAFNEKVPPVPIPNTAVKLLRADNTWLETAREDMSVPARKKTSYTRLFLRLVAVA